MVRFRTHRLWTKHRKCHRSKLNSNWESLRCFACRRPGWYWLGAKHKECIPHIECPDCANFHLISYVFLSCMHFYHVYFASSVNVTASKKHAEGKCIAESVGRNVEKVKSLAFSAMCPQRVNHQIVRIQVSRRRQDPTSFSAQNFNDLLQINLMFLHQAIFFDNLNQDVYHSTSCNHCADFRKQAR